ncbi:MAG: sulfatase [Chthoniobacter sp.]|nr:sulfatase [Chthoniobacter sp.]
MTTPRKNQRALFTITALFALSTLHAADGLSKRPNILFIVADDMGYADCGAHGCSDIPTPNLDALAAGGIRFTDGYVTGTVCSPSRAALMTARYHQRDGVSDWIPPGHPGMNADVPTVAGYLQKSGYHTALVGKWHLGEHEQCQPLKRGFDEFSGFLGGGHQYIIQPNGKGEYNAPILRNLEPSGEKRYLTEAFGDEAAAFIAHQRDATNPFFLYLAFNAVHTPLQATEKYLQKFAGIADTRRRTYAAMLSAMDEAIGRVLNAVRETGLEENTLICFISDNGGPITRNAPNASLNTPLRGGKGETWEGGIRVPFFLKWKGRLKAGTTFTQPVIQMDITATVLALAGVEPDVKWPIDGVNLLPFLNGDKTTPHPMLCWEYGPQWAIREGQWKLTFAMPDKDAKTPVLGLYDLSQDIGETHNLAPDQPERVKQLQADWTKWRKSIGGDKLPPKENLKGVNASP